MLLLTDWPIEWVSEWVIDWVIVFVPVQKVVHGKYNGTVDVAIKMPKEASMSEDEFVAEANTMTSVFVFLSYKCFL